MLRRLGYAVAFAVLAGCGTLSSVRVAATSLAGKKVPGFTLKDLAGEHVSLSSFFRTGIVHEVVDGRAVLQTHEAKPVLLVLGRMTCRYSLDELLEVDRLARGLGKDRLVILGVVEGERKETRDWAQSNGVAVRIVMDDDGRILGLYSVEKTPVVCLISANGLVVYNSGGGFLSGDELQPLVEALLEGKGLGGITLPQPGAG